MSYYTKTEIEKRLQEIDSQLRDCEDVISDGNYSNKVRAETKRDAKKLNEEGKALTKELKGMK